jgi:hypothetical protein
LNNDLLVAAQSYHDLGLSVIPFVINSETGKKEPDRKRVPEWKQWQTRLQTQEEFSALHIEEYSMFGVICGTPLTFEGETVYFTGIDRDIKDQEISDEIKDKTKTALNEMKPCTSREETLSKGDHLAYLSRVKVNGKKIKDIGMELLGFGNLMVVAPSKGYRKINDNSLTVVDNAADIFFKTLTKFDLIQNRYSETKPQPEIANQSHQELVSDMDRNQLRPCFPKLMQKVHLSHDEKVAIIYEMSSCGLTKYEIAAIFQEHKAWEPPPLYFFDPEKTAEQINYTVNKAKEGYMRYRRETLQDLEICFPQCPFYSTLDCRIVQLEHINNIERPELLEKPIRVDAVIASTSIAYTVPSEINADVTILDKEGNEVSVEKKFEKIAINEPINVTLTAVPQATVNKIIRELFQPENASVLVSNIKKTKHRAVYVVRVRPTVFTLEKIEGKTIDDKGYEYKFLDLYIISDIAIDFIPSTLIRIIGKPIPHPKTQKITLLAYEISFPENIEKFDKDKLNLLKAKFEGKSTQQRLSWILDNFESYSHIYGRRNLATTGLLAYYSPLRVQFNGDVQRGWVIAVIIGDTTTAKSETVKKLVKLLKGGSLISAETASTVGLTGTATQLENQGWFIEWGFLPLMDRQLLAIDGAHKLSASCYAALAEAERSGVLSITKAAKNTTYARTRQIRISNAIDQDSEKYTTKSLKNFLYPSQALETILDKTSIARLDLVALSDQRDVPLSQINKRDSREYEKELDILSEVRKLVWGNNARVEWTEKAIDTLLEKATELYNLFFFEAIPIVTVEMKWKLARLSVSLAYLTLSINNDYTVVTVTEEHVIGVVTFLTNEYTNAGIGLLAQTEKFEKLELKDASEIIQILSAKLVGKIEYSLLLKILQYLTVASRTTKDQIKAKFDLAENNQVRPLLAELKAEELLTSKRGFYPTPKLIEMYKLTNSFDFNTLNTFNKSKMDTPSNSQPESNQTPHVRKTGQQVIQ